MQSFAVNRLVRATLAVASLLLLCASWSAAAQIVTVRERSVTPNGRPVQEIRFGNEPGGGRTQMRVLVVTNGPTAGTTSLLTAVADANVWVDVGAPAPAFTPIIASGTVFSVGGGCTRGAQTDYPFINAFRPQILRFVGGSFSVITPFTGNTNPYDSAECVVSGDGTETYFAYTNRQQSRIDFYRDRGGPNDLDQAFVAFGSIKTPFAGGLRPALSSISGGLPAAMSSISGTNHTMEFLVMSSNGQTRWRQYNFDLATLFFDCQVGVQTPAPIAFRIPRGSEVAGLTSIGDFNDDGVVEVVTVNPSGRDGCVVAPPATPAGPVFGSVFNWVEIAAAYNPITQIIAFFYTRMTVKPRVGPPNTVAGPHASGGPHAACAAFNTEVVNAYISAAVGTANTIKMAHTNDTTSYPPAPGQQHIFRSSFDIDTDFITVLCDYFDGAFDPPP